MRRGLAVLLAVGLCLLLPPATEAFSQTAHSQNLRVAKLTPAQKLAAARLAAARRAAASRLAAKRLLVQRIRASIAAQKKAETVPIALPVAAGIKPTAATTGVPDGAALKVWNGDMILDRPGMIIDHMDIRGYVTIISPNVTIKRSIIRGPTVGPTNHRGLLTIAGPYTRNYRIEDVTIAARVASPYLTGVRVSRAGVFNRVDVSGTIDGFMIYGSGVNVFNSYLHDFIYFEHDPVWNGGPSHSDSLQVQGGRGIRIVNNNAGGAHNAALMVTQDYAATNELSVVANWFDDGGCTVFFLADGAYQRGMRLDNNIFGSHHRSYALRYTQSHSDLAPTGNVYEGQGQPVDVRRL